MSHSLAVMTPAIGEPSETFIRRHVNDLLPGRTAVVCIRPQPFNGPPQWSTEGPVLALHPPMSSLTRRLADRILRPSSTHGSLIAFLRSHHVRVVLAEYLDVWLPHLRAVLDLGIPFFAHGHGYDMSLSLRDQDMCEAYRQYGAAAGVIVPSDYSRQRLVRIGLDETAIHVVPYGVDVPDRPPRHDRFSRNIRCLSVGRLVPKKSPLLLVEAFASAAKIFSALRLDVIGGGPCLATAQQLAAEIGVAGRITFHGPQPSRVVAQFLQRADIFLQHSNTDPVTGDEEGLPVAILEAMAHALPVVSTVHAGIPEAVRDGVTGFLVAEGDVRAMGDRIAALAYDAAARAEMGFAGWSEASERFSWRQERDSLLELMALAGWHA